jgi:Tetratricopeptide repeat
MNRFPHRKYFLTASIALALAFVGCAPQRPYRPAYPRNDVLSEPRNPPPPPVYAPLPQESDRRPLPRDPRIHEQDLKSKTPQSTAKESTEPGQQAKLGQYPAAPEPIAPLPTPPPLPDDSSLLAKITPGVTAQRAASLRLTDEGSKLLDAGEPAKALARLERTIVIDSTNAYGYFYLAKAHYRLGRYRESLNFLGVVESRLSGEPYWLAELHALRGDNYRALGQLQRAEESYLQALKLNSGNRTAADGLARLQVESPSASR